MSEDGLVKVFNFAHPELDRIERLPVNTICAHCEEPIRQDDSGFSLISVDEHGHGNRVYEHRACFLRTVLGSVAHIEERCSCFVPGATCTDPEGMTRRQAAEAAVSLYESRHHD
jgi:hypothetical protein